MKASRRDFLKTCCTAALAAPGAAALSRLVLPGAAAPGAAGLPSAEAAEPGEPGEPVRGRIVKTVEARFYEKLDNKRVECTLCPNRCKVGDRERGYCGVRENHDGTYVTLVYGNPCSGYDGGMPDPIEKKPLFHFLPGTTAYSIATAGCNVECKFCQNWQISQSRPEQTDNFELLPEAVVANAKRYRCDSIAFTYSEPVVFYEYMYDTAELGRKQGIRGVMISNGYIEPEPMKKLCEVLGAVKVDLKAFTDDFYTKIVNGKLQSVLDTLVLLQKQGIWHEIVYLVIPTLNDNLDDIRAMSRWIRKELGPMVPLHFSAFYPTYKLRNLPRTPPATVDAARDAAMAEGIKYVYVGNVWRRDGHPGESTWCHNCGKKIIFRIGFALKENHVVKGKCEYCGAEIPGVWA